MSTRSSKTKVIQMPQKTKYASEKYGMGIDLQTTKRHPGYSENLSPEENVRKGRRYRGGQSYKLVAKQLQQLANIGHHEVFRRAAELARERAHQKGEYKED